MLCRASSSAGKFLSGQVSAKGNLFDHSRALALRSFFKSILSGKGRLASSQEAAMEFFPRASKVYRSRSVRNWAEYFLAHFELPHLSQGQHQKIPALIDDEDVRRKCVEFLKGLKPARRTAGVFARWISKSLLPRISSGSTSRKKVSTSTATTWLHALNWEYGKHG